MTNTTNNGAATAATLQARKRLAELHAQEFARILDEERMARGLPAVADDPAQLRREIAALRRELRELRLAHAPA